VIWKIGGDPAPTVSQIQSAEDEADRKLLGWRSRRKKKVNCSQPPTCLAKSKNCRFIVTINIDFKKCRHPGWFVWYFLSVIFLFSLLQWCQIDLSLNICWNILLEYMHIAYALTWSALLTKKKLWKMLLSKFLSYPNESIHSECAEGFLWKNVWLQFSFLLLTFIFNSCHCCHHFICFESAFSLVQ